MEDKFYSLKVNVGVETNFSLDKNFSLQIDEHDTRFLPVDIVVKKDEIEVALVKILVIDTLIYEEPQYMLELADDLDLEYYEVLEDFVKSSIFKKLSKDGFCRIGYISRFYVYPMYRNKGIGNFLLENLEQILENTLCFDIGVFLVFFCPLEYDGNLWTPNGDETMKKIMVNLFKKKGFCKMAKSENYIKFMY